jgi:hypothetical protein|tara:strand:- start:6 stop:395 length:390 start_codon:yes stop_codon:yes gene_type:complete
MNKRWIIRTPTIRHLCVEWIKSIELRPDAPLFEVVVKPYKKNRSLEQNDMFHAWCGSIAEKTGHTKMEIKDIILEQVFGSEEYLNFQGERRSRLRQTSGMTVQEMSELIERATQLGIELGADVPEVTHG